jgi:hypothetical protein
MIMMLMKHVFVQKTRLQRHCCDQHPSYTRKHRILQHLELLGGLAFKAFTSQQSRN